MYWVDADLSGPEWTSLVGERYDAAVSATALHWLAAGDVPAFASALASVLRPGGVFVTSTRCSPTRMRRGSPR